jgi:glycosyltransferase involved in cell wall biosynthesis
MPLIRVVIPTHNRAFVIHEALGTVRRQTFADFEVIVVDDGSTDDTVAVVQRIAAEEPRIRLLRVPHGGVAKARNAGIQEEGAHEYVAFLDSDDLWLPSHLDRAMQILGNQPEVGVFFSRVDVSDPLWSQERMQEYRRRQREPVKLATPCGPDLYFLECSACRRALLFSRFTPKPSSVVVRRRAVHREPWFRTDLMVLEDAEFFLALAAKDCHFLFDDEVHVQMRRFGDNLSGGADWLSARAALRFESVLRYDKVKLTLCSGLDESAFVTREIAETAYLIGQNCAERLELAAARTAYRESLRCRFSYRAAKGLVKSMLPGPLHAVFRGGR